MLPANFAALPNPSFLAEWTDRSGIAPGMDRKHRRFHGSGDVHRSAVYADDKSRGTNQPDHLSNRREVKKVDRIGGQFLPQVTEAYEHYGYRINGMTKFHDVFVSRATWLLRERRDGKV